jgi:uncharacterized membrane protein
VTFAALDGGGCRLSVELDYRLKGGNALTPLVNALFVRRAFASRLRRTLVRFKRELAFDVELEAGSAS